MKERNLNQACVEAYQSKYPIIFIHTNELELVRRVAASDRIVVRMMRRGSAGDVAYMPCRDAEGEEFGEEFRPHVAHSSKWKPT